MVACLRNVTFLVLPLAFLAACTEPMTVKEQSWPVQVTKRTDKFCTFHITSIIDRRLDPTALGSVGSRPIRAPDDVQHWLRAVLNGLETRGVRVLYEDDAVSAVFAGSPVLNVKVELISTWLDSLGTSKVVNVVMQFDYAGTNSPPVATKYRGNRTALNWSNGEGEIQGLLDEGFDEILDKVASDTRTLCAA